MRLWKFYTGRTTFDQDLLPLDHPRLLEWEARLSDESGGFTRYETFGVWTDYEHNAELSHEPGLVYEVVDFDHCHTVETMNALRHGLRRALGQQSVLLTINCTGEVIRP